MSGLNHAMHNMEEVAQEQQESTQNSDCPDCPKNESLVKYNSSDGNTYSFERGSWRLVGQTTSIERFADKGPTLRQADNSGSTPS